MISNVKEVLAGKKIWLPRVPLAFKAGPYIFGGLNLRSGKLQTEIYLGVREPLIRAILRSK